MIWDSVQVDVPDLRLQIVKVLGDLWLEKGRGIKRCSFKISCRHWQIRSS